MFSYKDGIIDFVIIQEYTKQTKNLQRNGAIITHCVKYARIPVLSHFYIPLKGRNRRTESLKTRILANFTQCVMITPFRNKVFYNYFNIVLCDIWILFYFQLDMNRFLFRFNRSRNSNAGEYSAFTKIIFIKIHSGLNLYSYICMYVCK